MADQKARFVPGTPAQEPVSLNEYIYAEADTTFKVGDPVAFDGFGVAHAVPEEVRVGVLIAPGYADEYIPKGQFGWFISKGATFAHNKALEIRAQKKAEQVIDTKTKLTTPDGKPIMSQTRSPGGART